MTSYLITEQETPYGESFGIVAVSDNATVSYADVTDRRDRMEALVSLCNELIVWRKGIFSFRTFPVRSFRTFPVRSFRTFPFLSF